MRTPLLALLICGCASPPAPPAAIPPRPPASACPPDMVLVAGGSYTLGDAAVTVSDFCLDRDEVTVERYRGCVDAGRCSADHTGDKDAVGDPEPHAACNFPHPERGHHPMNCVSHTQAEAYCRARDQQLPSEAQWEWAARGGARGTPYPWGTAAPDARICWSGVALRQGTCEVGSTVGGESPIGIRDLIGNVWEWTSTPNDKSFVLRGGGFADPAQAGVTATSRTFHLPHVREPSVGFRCAR